MKKIILFSNDDAHFYNHLLPIALEAKQRGYTIRVLTNVINHQQKIEENGLSVIPVEIKRGNLNPFIELILLLKVIRIISQEKPDILHNFTIKPIIYGTIAGFFCKTSKIINNFLGMGYLFINNSFVPKTIRIFLAKILSFIGKYKNIIFIVQNEDDRKLLVDLNIAKEDKVINQCSVGIDSEQSDLLPEKKGAIIFALVARMLVDKGINEFIDAAKLLHKKGIEAEFWLVGSPDKSNAASVDEEILEEYHKQGFIKYLGYQNDIRKIWQDAHVAVLPSYREGLSRSLLEAGGYGRAIITTDAPGGRELIKDKINGLLVPLKDSRELATAMEKLVNDVELRKSLATTIRSDVLKNYDSKLIAQKIVSFYL